MAIPRSATVVKRGLADTPFGQVHYRVAGAGEPLILLHASVSSSHDFDQMLPILSRKRRVVAMDTLGFGDSDRPASPPSLEDFAKTVVALMDSLGFKTASLAGHHTGAYIAAQVAASYPDRVDKLILEGMFNMDAEERRRQVGKWLPIQYKQDGSHLVERWQQSMRSSGDPQRAHRGLLDALKAGEAGVYGFWAVIKHEQEKLLPLIQCPTLLIWGDEDLKFMDNMGWKASRDAHKVNEGIRRRRVVIIPEVGHYMPTQMPDRFSALILEFLENPGV